MSRITTSVYKSWDFSFVINEWWTYDGAAGNAVSSPGMPSIHATGSDGTGDGMIFNA